MPKQVQDFYPTPSTRSTCIYYTGIDPDTMKPVFVPKSPEEKRMQRALLQYRLYENRDLVNKAYILAGLNEKAEKTNKKPIKTQTNKAKNNKKSNATRGKKEFIHGEKVFRNSLSSGKNKKK